MVVAGVAASPTWAHGGEGAICDLITRPFFWVCDGLTACIKVCPCSTRPAPSRPAPPVPDYVVPPCFLASLTDDEAWVGCPGFGSAVFERAALENDHGEIGTTIRRPETMATARSLHGVVVDASLMRALHPELGEVEGDVVVDARTAAGFQAFSLNRQNHVQGDLVLLLGLHPFTVLLEPGAVVGRVVMRGNRTVANAMLAALRKADPTVDVSIAD